MRIGPTMLMLLLALMANPSAALESAPTTLRTGQWLEVRGEYVGEGDFKAARADLIQPEKYQVLIGTVSGQDENGNIVLLDQFVEIQEKTEVGKIDAAQLLGQRVKVEGYYRGPGKFSARELDPRGKGRQRIVGRIDQISKRRSKVWVNIMNYRVEIPSDVLIEHDEELSAYKSTESSIEILVNNNRDDDDLFGEGYWITDSLQVSGQAQLKGLSEREFNLNERDPENRDDIEGNARARFVYQHSDRLFAVAELNHRQLYRSDEDDGRLSDDSSKLGETYLYWINPFDNGLDLQVGRIDFDDPREFIYDQNLDGVRGIWKRPDWQAQVSYSETLSDGSPVDESAQNLIVYVSNVDDDRHLAGYVVHRQFDFPVDTRRTHYGVRMLGEWLDDNESWLELSWMDGHTGSTPTRGLAIDLGSSWQFHDYWSLTAGFAWGQGNSPGGEADTTYRQTGIQDNNGKFHGVTSFRYYGELVDPELANLAISTAGLGFHPGSDVSLELVWHSYRQDQLSTRLVDSDLDKRPNGIHRDLGHELDLVLGWRTRWNMDIEVIAARFSPGAAFTRADKAYLGKVQLRYRF